MSKETQPTPEELAALQAAQGEVLAEQQAEIARLKAELAAAAAGQPKVVIAADLPSVKLGKETYKVRHGLIIGGKNYSREELAANPDLCANALEAGTTALIKL
jgi:hypothetical protein